MTLPDPYYEREGITIYHGDSRGIIPQLGPLDLVFTDPPFGVGLASKRPAKMRKHAGDTYTFGADTREYVESVCVPIIRTCVEQAKRVVVTPGVRSLFLYPEPTTVWCIHWPNGAGRGRWSAFNCWSPLVCYGDASKRRGAIPDTFVTTEQAGRNGHPCPKPLQLWKRILLAISNPGECVVDPFMGSGTTLRAAKDLGLRSIGIDVEEKYCEIAVRRLQQDVFAWEG